MRSSRCLWAVVAMAGCALAQPQLTTVQDVLYKADGTRFNGTLTISWTSFQASDNSAIVTQSTTVKVLDGILHVQLVPTTSGTPAIAYTVTYNSDGRVQFQETWSVPWSAQPVRVRDVRVATAGSSTGSGSVAADSSVEEANVTGLIADLGARAMKGPGYAPGRVAVVDAAGLLEAAVGSATDCVHVDGSSGPCGGTEPSFVDGDSPAGIVDGSNTMFSLSWEPNPVASLSLYRNGLRQKPEQDYTLTGQTIQFVAAATPQPGDTLLASYRLGDSDATTATTPYATAQVLCSGTGLFTTSTTPTSLGTCAIPSGLLQPGDRVEMRFDFEHQGSAGGLSVEVNWGGTTVLHRDAAASETLLTGRMDAALTAAGAQVSSQNWGAASGLAATVAGATDAYASGLTVDFRGGLTASGDTLYLRGFTVVRWP
jgi:hypothetical protein